MNLTIEDKNNTLYESKLLCEKLKILTKKLETIIEEEDKKIKYELLKQEILNKNNFNTLPVAGISSQHYSIIGNQSHFINSLRS